MPVAERLYYADSFLTAFPAVVTDIRELHHAEGVPVWQIALDRSAFYPGTGGQPFDTGILRATSRGGAEIEVSVEEVVEDEDGEIWHYITKPLAAGTHVEARIDWQRRFDHMQQHSGQHLLSAVFLRELHAPTVSFHLGDSVSTIDLAGGAIASASLERIEQLANEIIAQNRPVRIRYVSRSEAEEMVARGELRKLPDRDGEIRIAEIEDCDRNACGGTHVRFTGQIGSLLLRGVQKVSRGTRVEFLCGLRAVRAARQDLAILNRAAGDLSVGPADLPGAIERIRNEARAGIKERQRLREELADYHAARLLVEVPFEHGGKGIRIIDRCWNDRDAEYIRLLASRIVAAAPRTAAVLCAGYAGQTRVVLARSLDLSFDSGLLLKEALARYGLRGGGSPDLAQGDIPAADSDPLRSFLVQAIRTAASAS